MCHSPGAYAIGIKLDLQGIILLIWGANVPLIYYGFVCDPVLQIVYWTISSFLAICCSVLAFWYGFGRPGRRTGEAVGFGMLGFSTVFPIIHGIIIDGYALQSRRLALDWVWVTAILNVLGASVYVLRVSVVSYLVAHACLLCPI